jgi:tetratricopeptide (TPR) repeat protein
VDEAVREVRRAYELDPLSISINLGLGAGLYDLEQYDQSIDQFRKTLEMEPDFVAARIHLVLPLLAQDKFDEAVNVLNPARTLTHDASPVMSLLGYVYAKMGKRQEAQNILRRFTETSKQPSISAFNLAVLHFGLGDRDRTFEYLHKACNERDRLLPYVNAEPFWAQIRADARFQGLRQCMGF